MVFSQYQDLPRPVVSTNTWPFRPGTEQKTHGKHRSNGGSRSMHQVSAADALVFRPCACSQEPSREVREATHRATNRAADSWGTMRYGGKFYCFLHGKMVRTWLEHHLPIVRLTSSSQHWCRTNPWPRPVLRTALSVLHVEINIMNNHDTYSPLSPAFEHDYQNRYPPT